MPTETTADRTRICLLATVPSTLSAFYRPLLEALPENDFEVTLVTSAGPELDAWERDGCVKVHRIEMARSISPFADLVALIRLVRYFRAHDFDLIHTHTPKAGLLGMLAGRFAGVPRRIHTMHGLPLEAARGLKRRVLTWTERLTCRSAHRVCVVSPSLRRQVTDLKLCDPDKVTMLGAGTACGIDLARFKRTDAIDEQARSIRREHGIDEGAVVVGYVGWLVADKGVTELVDAFATLAGARDDLHLLMIGADGTARDPLPTRTLDAVRQHPRIHHAGLVDEPAVYYAAMDFCVLPSRREGFPYAPLEAAALGVPTIATAVTGCVDAVADERTGLLVGPEDPGALRDAIRRLADAPEDRSRLGDAARSRVCEHFSSQRMVDEHIALYRGPKKVSG